MNMQGSNSLSAKVKSEEAVVSLLEELSRPWTLQILWRLGKQEKMRFGEIKDSVEGISARILTDRLRRLEDCGYVTRHRIPSSPPRVDYELNEKGLALCECLDPFEGFALNNID